MKRLAEKNGDLVQPNLRIREELRQKLEREAKRNQRSLNREMTIRLEQSLEVGALKSISEVVGELTKTLSRVRKQFDRAA